MQMITIPWVLMALIVCSSAAPVPSITSSLQIAEHGQQLEVRTEPVTPLKPPTALPPYQNYASEPIEPPVERSEDGSSEPFDKRSLDTVTASLEARKLHIIHRFPGVLTPYAGRPPTTRSEESSQDVAAKLEARSQATLEEEQESIAARSPAPSPGEHDTLIEGRDDFCGELGQYENFGQKNVAFAKGDELKYLMGAEKAELQRRSHHKGSCGERARSQKEALHTFAKRQGLPSKEFEYAMTDLGPMTPMDYNSSRHKKAQSSLNKLADDEPTKHHEHFHHHTKNANYGYQTVQLNDLDRTPLPLSQLTGLGPEVKGSFHGFKRREVVGAHKDEKEHDLNMNDYINWSRYQSGRPDGLLVGSPGMSTMAVGPQVSGFVRRSLAVGRSEAGAALPMQKREAVNYGLYRAGHDAFGMPLIHSDGNPMAEYERLYGKESKRNLELDGGPEKIKAIANQSHDSKPSFGKEYDVGPDALTKGHQEHHKFTRAELEEYQKTHHNFNFDTSEGLFSKEAERGSRAQQSGYGHLMFPMSKRTEVDHPHTFTGAELEEYKKTHHNFKETREDTTRSAGKGQGEVLTRHGSYWTTNKPNKSAEAEFDHLRKGKEGTTLLGAAPEGEPRPKSRVPADLLGEPGIGADGRFDENKYRETCYPGLKAGMYTTQQNQCNGAF